MLDNTFSSAFYLYFKDNSSKKLHIIFNLNPTLMGQKEVKFFF